MFRIGVVNLDVSHPKVFSEYLLKGTRAKYTAVYNDGFRTDEEVNAFIESSNLEKRYFDLDEMAQNIDIAFIQGCNWDKHIEYAMPFINAGKPVFIDKPMVGNLKDCKKLEELVKNGAVIIGSSALRYCNEVNNFINTPVEERGEIVHITTTVGVDEFNYSIHAVETIMGLMGDQQKAESVTYVGSTKLKDVTCESYKIQFKNGVTAMYHTYLNGWQASTMTVMTTKKTIATTIDTSTLYSALLDRICDYLEGKETDLASIDGLTESIKIMLAGRLSKLKFGTPVLISEIPDADEGFDGFKFETEYSETANKTLYLSK